MAPAETEARALELRAPPQCPSCAVASEAAPDAYGVYRCSGCGVEFRPPWRVPVRPAGVSAVANQTEGNGWLGVAAVGALIIGVTIAVADSRAPSQPPPLDALALDPKLFEPKFEPIVLEDLQLGLDLGLSSLTVDLDYEVHVSSLERDELTLTGLVRNPSAYAVEAVEVEVRGLDATGQVLETRAATTACGQLAVQDVCAWALEVEVPAIVGFEIEARAQRALIGLERLDLRARFDAEGRRVDAGEVELELGLARREVRFALEPGLSAFDVDAVVVRYDGDGKVLGLERTSWPGMVSGGFEQRRPVSVRVDEDVAEYELRVLASLVSRAVLEAPQ